MSYLISRSTRDSSKFAIFTKTKESVMQFAYPEGCDKIASITDRTQWLDFNPRHTKKITAKESAQLEAYLRRDAEKKQQKEESDKIDFDDDVAF